MNRLIVETSHGPLYVVGRLHAPRPRVTLLIVSGSYPPEDHMHDYVDRFPGANVIVGGLPGTMGMPYFADLRPETFRAAYDQLIATLLRDQPVVALGMSTGCLVTLGLTAPNIVRHIAQEPFFSTARLTRFIADARERMALNPQSVRMREFLFNLFGIGETAVEDRDYAALIDGISRPTDVIVGRLELADPGLWPSFTSAEERARLAARPDVTLHEAPANLGHHVAFTPQGDLFAFNLVHASLRAVARQTAETPADAG